jgi:16S rRNA (guanine966-N2)-methyltransferase
MKSRAAPPLRRESVSSGTTRGSARGAGEVRIIGGQWRRTRLPVLDRPGLRPTPDRVRETLFNWLGQSLEGWRCADVFAGTGALGLEAASRGATQVVLCEQDRALAQQLQHHLTKLQAQQVQLVQGDGLHWVRQQAGANWDLVFLDPPFAAEWFEAAVQAASQAIASQGQVYLESPRAWTDDSLANWGLKVHRYLQAGAVHAHLLVRT